MATFLFIFGVIIIIFCLVSIFFLSKGEAITILIYKTGICENDMSDRLKNKEDLIIRSINIIVRQLKLDIKIFDEVKNIKSSKLNNYEIDKLLSKAHNEINKIYIDNPSLKDIKSFDGIIKDLEKLEIEMISLRTLYNKCACEFNNFHSKFTYSFICKAKKFSIKSLYEGREIKGEIEKELKFLVEFWCKSLCSGCCLVFVN